MKRIFIVVVTCLLAVNLMNGNTSTNSYLKIEINSEKSISYPPGTNFIAQDENENTVLNPALLEKVKIYNINQPITLYVFVSWNDEPDTYHLKSGALLLGKTDRTYTKNIPNDHFKRPTDGSYAQSKNTKKAQGYRSNGVYLLKERYFSYEKQTGYDTSLEFSNGVIFYYKNGNVSAWKNGEALPIKNKYIISTPNGFLKISYKPMTKKLWWVFEKR